MGNYFFKQNNTKTMAEVHDMSYYKKCMMGGILSCGITHTMVCPLDIVKCRMQANPGMYANVFDGFRQIKAGQGMHGFTLGWFPTAIGYSMQGFGKFGFDVSSACAEFIADIMLCPSEAVKVKMQTSDAG